ncbi:MAG: ORF6N domain-containing protein, partial [Gemmatimonadales bacterium]
MLTAASMATYHTTDLPTTAADATLAQRVERRILLMRGAKVMLDSDLAQLYGVGTKTLN